MRNMIIYDVLPRQCGAKKKTCHTAIIKICGCTSSSGASDRNTTKLTNKRVDSMVPLGICPTLPIKKRNINKTHYAISKF